MKFLAMHITNQKLSFNIFTVGNLQNIFMEHDGYMENAGGPTGHQQIGVPVCVQHHDPLDSCVCVCVCVLLSLGSVMCFSIVSAPKQTRVCASAVLFSGFTASSPSVSSSRLWTYDTKRAWEPHQTYRRGSARVEAFPAFSPRLTVWLTAVKFSSADEWPSSDLPQTSVLNLRHGKKDEKTVYMLYRFFKQKEQQDITRPLKQPKGNMYIHIYQIHIHTPMHWYIYKMNIYIYIYIKNRGITHVQELKLNQLKIQVKRRIHLNQVFNDYKTSYRRSFHLHHLLEQ